MYSNSFVRTALCGFIAGAIAYLVFHQGGFWALNQAGVLKASTWPMVSTKPFGVPQVVSYMFWTGLWGVLAAFLVPRLPMPRWLGCSGCHVQRPPNWWPQDTFASTARRR